MSVTIKIIAFLRGINVGGHHKVSMAQLRNELTLLGASNVKTLLNSGNAVFDTMANDIEELQQEIESHLSNTFGFQVPVLLRKASHIQQLVEINPFQAFEAGKETMFYVSFLKKDPRLTISLPRVSADRSLTIIAMHERAIFSILDVSLTKTPKGMDELEKLFGKDITTRNWNTVLRVAEL